MKPIQLTLTGFGSYKEKRVIDFSKLGDEGIYLIHGKTGAGKTFLFDGITYALFGKASGEDRASHTLRSLDCTDDMPTEVTFVFEYRGEVYRVKRNPEYMRAKKGSREGMTKQLASAELRLPDGTLITRPKEVDGRIAELLGVNRSQFTQIAMIAQGAFDKILKADTKVRQGILRTLFDTSRYKVLQDRLQAKARGLEEEYRQVDISMKQQVENMAYGMQEGDDAALAGKLERIRTGVIKAEEAMELAEAVLARDRLAYDASDKGLQQTELELQTVNANILKGETFLRIKQELQTAREEQKKAVQEKKDAEQALEEAEAHRPEIKALEEQIMLLNAELPKYDDLQMQEDAQKSLTVHLKKCVVKKEQLTKRILEEKEKLAALQEEYKTYDDVRERIAQLSAEKKTEEEKDTDCRELARQIASYHKGDEAYRALQEDYRKKSAAAQMAEAAFSSMQKAFLDGQAGLLAQELTDGQPCPVCGAVEHPKKAELKAEAPTKADVEAAKGDYDRKQTEAQLASETAQKKQGVLETMKQQILAQITRITGKPFDGTDMEALAAELAAFQDEVQAALRQLGAALEKEEMRGKRREFVDAAIKKLEEEIRRAEQDSTDHTEAIATGEAKLEMTKKQILQLRKSLRFETKEDAIEARDDRCSRKDQLSDGLDRAKEACVQLEKRMAATGGKIAELEKQVAEGNEIDLEQERSLQESLMQKREKLQRRKEALHARSTINERARSWLQENTARLAELHRSWQMTESLARTFNGTLPGREKITLETYIQTAFFDRIIARANKRFMVMSEGRYELARREVAIDKRLQNGLEVDIKDHYNGSRRPAQTASGGETFMASLSLALGLSDEIQASSGGIQMDSLFVDEGFGTLDDDVLELAVRTLVEVTEGKRLVGIISHKNELKERIDKKILVTKDVAAGSMAEVVV